MADYLRSIGAVERVWHEVLFVLWILCGVKDFTRWQDAAAEFVQAAAAGDIPTVEELVRRGMRVNIYDGVKRRRHGLACSCLELADY